MSVSARSLLVPGMALATAGVLALSPAVVAPSPVSLAAPLADVPMVQIADIQLVGIGRDIYDSITAFVQYTVSSAQYWVGLIPVIGPPIADQLGINYFQGIQPIVESTVYALSDIIANPLNTIAVLANYGANLSYTAYNWASLQAQFFGLPGLPPIPAPPPLAAVKAPVRGAATPSPAAAVEAPTAEAAAAVPAKSGAVRAARKAQAADTDAPRAAATVAKAAAASDDDGGAASGDETRSVGKASASRGGAAGR